MKFSRILRLRTTTVVLCAMLLAQWALAAHACPTLRLTNLTSDAARAAHSAIEASHSGTDCGQAGDDESAIGYKHCNTDEQVSGGLGVAFAAPPPLLGVARASDAIQPVARSSSIGLAYATAPPLKILYCVSLT